MIAKFQNMLFSCFHIVFSEQRMSQKRQDGQKE